MGIPGDKVADDLLGSVFFFGQAGVMDGTAHRHGTILKLFDAPKVNLTGRAWAWLTHSSGHISAYCH